MRMRALALLVPCLALVLTAACGDDDESVPAPSGSTGGPCGTSGDCAQPFPYCAAGACVECMGDPNCGQGQSCNLETHSCVDCVDDGDCGGDQPYCGPDGECVECLGTDNCGGDDVCDPLTNRCRPGCAADADCANPDDPYCHATRKVCVECLGDGNCESGGQPYCDATAGSCVECLTNANCTGDNALCEPNRHDCVECLTDADCPMNLQCNGDGQCD